MMASSGPDGRRTVAIYGGAGVLPGQPDWDTAYQVGHALGAAGYTVMSGGYAGVMEAASQGAAEAGAHVIGVGVGLFAQRGLRPNRWVSELVTFDTLRERLYYLVERPDALVVLRGGVGTLSEMALVWSLIQVGELPPRPFVLVGRLWRRLAETLRDEALLDPRELNRLTLVDGAADVVPALRAWWDAPPDVPLRLGDNGGDSG